MKNLNQKSVSFFSMILLTAVMAACGDANLNPQGYYQTSRVGRPGTSVGLIVNASTAQLYTVLGPNQDLANATLMGEITTSLTNFAKLGADLSLGTAQSPTTSIAALFPDQIRFDSTVSAPPGTRAYNIPNATTPGSSCAGRKLEDDVMDVMMSYFIAGDASGNAVKDNVAYAGVPGNSGQPGHQLLNGQTTRQGPATFPYLAPPN